MSTVTSRREQIAADLRTAILDGRYAPGDPLPSANRLASDYGITRATARRALELLHDEGLIDLRQGALPSVRSSPVVHVWGEGIDWRRHRDAGRPGFDATVAEHGMIPRQEILDVQEAAPAPARIAARLRTGDDTLVMRYVRQFADDVPARLVRTWFPAWARGTALSGRRRIRGGVGGWIENPDGPVARRLATSRVEIGGRMPSSEERELLGLDRSVPVLEVLRTFLDADGEPVYVQQEVADAPRHRYEFRVDL